MPEPSNYDAIRRRPAGKTMWKVTLYELIESERSSLAMLRALGNRHPNDVETQRVLNQILAEAAERLVKLHELALYRDADAASGTSSDATQA